MIVPIYRFFNNYNQQKKIRQLGEYDTSFFFEKSVKNQPFRFKIHVHLTHCSTKSSLIFAVKVKIVNCE